MICRRQALQLVRERGPKKKILVGTAIAKAKITGTGSNYTKEIIIVTRSFHDKIYIVSMGMNTKFKVDSHFFNA